MADPRRAQALERPLPGRCSEAARLTPGTGRFAGRGEVRGASRPGARDERFTLSPLCSRFDVQCVYRPVIVLNWFV